MRILIPSIHVPFIKGGAQLMIAGLATALGAHGHEVETIGFPFKFQPETYLKNLMTYCAGQDFENFNGYHVDRVIALQFPAYYVNHPHMVLWLMHQHRSVYELYDHTCAAPGLAALKKQIHGKDSTKLSAIPHRYSMCQNVSNRLERYNGIQALPLYHPPANADRFYCKESYDYIFFPSRLEHLKRQDLLIRAMAYTKSPVNAIIAGEGGQRADCEELIRTLNLGDRVRLVGHISEQEKIVLFARSLGVFFGPFDEDYGYVTLEAMLSSKPVITCRDSGGPLEFVLDNETGFIVEPDPEAIARKMDFLYWNKQTAREMGRQGKAAYSAKNISWNHVVETLLS
jgi:glycosyltransferase involved in cell wall biosynthesis